MRNASATLRRLAARTAAVLPRGVRDRLRPLAQRARLAPPPGDWWSTARPPWSPPTAQAQAAGARCNVCHWSGPRFDGIAHVESATCPRCGSIARDRFLLWCFVGRTPDLAGRRVLETSPRLGDGYRTYMRTWFDYRASDFDLGAHAADVQIDLQDIALPSGSVDVVLTPHVLEHVPDTTRAIAELHRVLAPGGRIYLQVPVLQGCTGVPSEPEFHQDNTPVFHRFGWDLTPMLRDGGFDTRVLVTAQLQRVLTHAEPPPDPPYGEFDVASMIEAERPADLTVAADDATARQLGFEPAHQFVTWECVRR